MKYTLIYKIDNKKYRSSVMAMDENTAINVLLSNASTKFNVDFNKIEILSCNLENNYEDVVDFLKGIFKFK